MPSKIGVVTPETKAAFDMIPGLSVRFTLTVRVAAADAGGELAELMRELADDFELGDLVMTEPDELAILENPDGEPAGCYTCHPEIRRQQ